MTNFIKNFRSDKVKTISFSLNFKIIKHKKIIDKFKTKLKQINNLIPSVTQIDVINNKKQFIYFSQHIFNAYIFKFSVPCSLDIFLFLLKKYKANKYEVENYKLLYCYYLLTYISKTNIFINFKELLIDTKIIKRIKNIKPQKQENNTKLGAISNGSFLFFACQNGYNYLQIDNNEITNFSNNLTKQHTISLIVDNVNVLENAQMHIYKTHIIFYFSIGMLDVKINHNYLIFDVKMHKKCNFSLIFDKCTKNCYKIKNKSVEINSVIKVKNLNNNSILINTTCMFGYSYFAKNKSKIVFNNTNFCHSNFNSEMHKNLQNELCSYYSTSNYKLLNSEIESLNFYNLNKQIKCLKLLNKFNFSQCKVDCNTKNYLLIERLNYNKTLLVPSVNTGHLFCDGEIKVVSNIFNGEQTLLAINCNFLYLDINSTNFFFSFNSKCIKIYIPNIIKTIYINFSSNIENAQKIQNFLKISIKNNQNILFNISFLNSLLKIDNIYKYFLKQKERAKNSVYVKFNEENFNYILFCEKQNKINFFDEQFLILYCLCKKINIFKVNFNSYINIDEIMYILLNFSNASNNTILEYYEKQKNINTFYQIKFSNYKSILNRTIDMSFKHKIIDQIGQYSKTIIDVFYLGNYKVLNVISNYYYCLVYLIYVNNISYENQIGLVDKKMFSCIKSFNLVLNNKNFIINIIKNNKSININNISFVGFSSIKNNNSIDLVVEG